MTLQIAENKISTLREYTDDDMEIWYEIKMTNGEQINKPKDEVDIVNNF